MPEGVTAENLLESIAAFADSLQKPKSVSLFEEANKESVGNQIRRLFGRQKPVHNLLGGGKSADVLLWRNKKISASVLASATAIWVLFEWLNYHFLTLLCLAIVLAMLAQFLLSNVSVILNRSPSTAPRILLPDELFVNIGIAVGTEVNRVLMLLQDISCEGNLKQFLMATLSLWAVSILGSWCNFLTVIYVGFVAAHTVPIIYERYEDEIDNFVYNLLDNLQHHYRKFDNGVLRKIPKGTLNKKHL